MLRELAIGDAYGAGFEYVSAEIVRAYNTGQDYRAHARHTIAPGEYTDDTQMSLAVAEALVSGEAWTPEMLAGRFVEVFHRDPRTGYAQRFYDFLRVTRTGEAFLANIRPDSDKSGAAMRAAPLGVLPTVAEVIEKCTVQARLTHDTLGGVAAACAAALSAHYFVYDVGPKARLGAWLEEFVPGHRWADPWQGKVGSKGWMSVRAAVTAVMECDTLSDLLRACIAFTGDVDTVAAVALAAASCSREYEKDLSPFLVDGLENARYGRNYIEDLDARLMALVGANG